MFFCLYFCPIAEIFCCWMREEIKEHIECLAEALNIIRGMIFRKNKNRVDVSEANSIE